MIGSEASHIKDGGQTSERLQAAAGPALPDPQSPKIASSLDASRMLLLPDASGIRSRPSSTEIRPPHGAESPKLGTQSVLLFVGQVSKT